MNRDLADKALARMVATGDEEADHYAADGALVTLLDQLGYGEVTAAWEKIGKWYA